MTTLTGTKEWAPHSVNCILGCAHNCRYCYAREMAHRFGRKDRDNWHNEEREYHQVFRRRPKLDGRIMFPTAHDITWENYHSCKLVLTNLLAAGNDLLIVTKPDPDVIGDLCARFEQFREQIEFRFAITGCHPEVLEYWEPNAPCFLDRMVALGKAHSAGYHTSVSIEPMLETVAIENLIEYVEPGVTDTIWLGKMNGIGRRVRIESDQDREMVAAIEAGQTNKRIWEIYERWREHPKIRWKDSIKKVIGLPLETAEQEPANG